MNVVDMHCDTIYLLLKNKRAEKGGSLRENQGHIDLLRLRDSGYLLQNFALYVNMGRVENAWEEALALLSVYEEEMQKNQDLVAPVYRYDDIAENQKQGKISSLLAVEEGGVCQVNVIILTPFSYRKCSFFTSP